VGTETDGAGTDATGTDGAATDGAGTDGGGTADAGDGEPRYTIDELALAAGLPSRTVRHYQSEGALPPPRRLGRAALYGPAHLERLRLIGRLQDRGLRLDAIRDALRQVERGHLSLEAWLGLGEQVRTPWSDDSPILLADPELEQTFGEPSPQRRPRQLARIASSANCARQLARFARRLPHPQPGAAARGAGAARGGHGRRNKHRRH
jgi:DNA-binding transcriptional MerR regulator